MVWAQLSINKPHLVYLILGGFTSLFMLCSSVIKERLYIGEATVATICGIIFGPHGAGLIDPSTWGNTDQITLEFARIVLVVQCFAVGVELPKAYMERHWRSVVLLLVPVMTCGWLLTSLFIYGLVPNVDWLDSLVIAACVTATDPVLASSVVGKGKFAKRVPKHIRDLLSAESGCNDGMAFPFIYLGLYLIKYRPNADEVAFHWICYTILYECIWGATYGVIIGYLARRAIRFAHERNIIDRESFLVFYFVLALFCAGSGSLLGMDDLLIGFACGVGFSNDGWFTEKTEETHVSNVIDLLINLAFFVYFGTIIPWDQYNADDLLGLSVWRLVVVAILVLLFRRIPVMLALKPIIPDIKTWREAFFCGHFGPIGVGAIFVAILARAELETNETTPLAELPSPDFPHDNIIELIWPVTTFLVICSIVVHGSSVAVFTLGKHINTLTLTMSYTQGNDSSWMERLPRIQSRSKTSMSLNRGGDSESGLNEKIDFPAGVVPKNFLRRQAEDDNPSRSSSRRPTRRKNYGGPVSQSAIAPIRSGSFSGEQPSMSRSDSETIGVKTNEGSPDNGTTKNGTPASEQGDEEHGEIYEEGGQTVYEDEDGEVMEVEDEDPNESEAKRQQHEMKESGKLMRNHEPHQHGKRADSPPHGGPRSKANAEHEAVSAGDHPGWRKGLERARTFTAKRTHSFAGGPKAEKPVEKKSGPARAYQYGNTIIVEDEDGEVIKKYDIGPPPAKGQAKSFADPARTRQRMHKMGSYLGVRPKDVTGEASTAGGGNADAGKKKKGKKPQDEVDDGVRFRVSTGGRRLDRAEFIQEIQKLDPKARAKVVEDSNVPEAVKREARADADEHDRNARKAARRGQGPAVQVQPPSPSGNNDSQPEIRRLASHESGERGPDGLALVDSNDDNIPFHDVTGELNKFNMQHSTSSETAAQRRRREARERAAQTEEDSEDDGTERIPPQRSGDEDRGRVVNAEEETAAERRRREDALGIRHDDSDSEDEAAATQSSGTAQRGETAADRRRREAALSPTRAASDEEEGAEEEDAEEGEAPSARPGIRFAENPGPQRDSSTRGRRRPRHWKS